MNIKWKITLSLLCVSLLLVASYVYTAQKIFQNDKISYIYEDQQSKTNSLVEDFNTKIENSISLSQFFIREHVDGQSLSSELTEIFKKQNLIEAIHLYNPSDTQTRTIVTKNQKTLSLVQNSASKITLKNLIVTAIEDDQFLISFPLKSESQDHAILLVKQPLSETIDSSMQYFMVDGAKIVKNFGSPFLTPESSAQLVQDPSLNKDDIASSTSRISLGEKNYLVTFAKTKFNSLKFISAINEDEALRALGELLNKSIIYLILSLLTTFIVSLILSHRLTFRMHQLTLVAQKIGQGDFDAPVNFESKDEVGVLAAAFKKMAQEIKQLFTQKIEKDRMERELKTAGLIQERLFPTEKRIRLNDFELSGYYITSTECGGDWWFYYRNGFDLYFVIADATGHGIPAALITSASNAIFSHIKEENYSLEKIVSLWDEAVYQSSKGEVFMTAQLVRVNLTTGNGEIVNLGHDTPIIYKSDKKQASFLKLPANFCLGDRSEKVPEIYTFSLDPGDQILLYSDGVLSMMDDDGSSFSDKQYVKKLNSFFDNDTFGEGTAQDIFEFLKRNSKRTLPGLDDDVTLVRLFRGTKE
jgi:sigma-B regulation protein RsbU (phosphoserine phosphatase)